jgi:ATP synthase protein I
MVTTLRISAEIHTFSLEQGLMEGSRPGSRQGSGSSSSGASPRGTRPPGRAYAILKFSSLGIEMAVAICIGLLLGYWLDLQFGTEPVLMLIGLGLGIAAGFLGVFRAAREAEQMMEAEQRAQDAARTETAGPGEESK